MAEHGNEELERAYHAGVEAGKAEAYQTAFHRICDLMASQKEKYELQ